MQETWEAISSHIEGDGGTFLVRMKVISNNSMPAPVAPDKTSRKYVTPTLAGILGAAQLSTACFVLKSSSATDFLFTAAAGPYIVWSVPLGALLGTTLAWVFLPLRARPDAWRERRWSWFYAIAAGFVCAPFAPTALGLGSQTTAQLWQGFIAEYTIAWFCLCTALVIERREFL
ncbi:MAG: hypothetical protein EOO38_01440 [Cytophagaceae bacterium]|nr:MAG: hypothetical protein EOO38_01440 [Cytophagaceae bacterium]